MVRTYQDSKNNYIDMTFFFSGIEIYIGVWCCAYDSMQIHILALRVVD